MTITSASIEANGWVLSLVHTGGVGSFASYALDPDGAPRVTLTTGSPGFATSGAAAVAATTSRTLVATKPLRKPVEATNAGVRSAKTIDETDLGGGSTRVRLALSQHVYASDTALTLSVAAGWRSGEAAASGIAVTNTSTLAAPSPIARWSDVPYQRRTGPFDLEVVAFSHHPNGLAPLAGVRFTATDGTNTATAWATALSTSPRYAGGGTGVGVRVYTVTIDPATATPAPLTEGLIRCDFKACPWIGPARASNPLDTALATVASSTTPSMTGLTTAGFGQGAQVPFVVAYDPAGTWLPQVYAYVATGGATVASTALISSNPATAAATPCADLVTARASMKLLNRVVAARNGQAASAAGATDGLTVRYTAGTYVGPGTGSVATGVSTTCTWEIVEGDPAAADPRSSCILQQATSGNVRASRTRFRNMTLELGPAALVPSLHAWADNVTLRGKAGSEATTSAAFSAGGNGANFFTNCRYWKHGSSIIYGTQAQPTLARNCEVERAIGAITVLNCTRLPSAVTGVLAINSSQGTGDIAGASQDRIVVGNDLKYLNGTYGWSYSATPNASAGAAALGTTYPVFTRQVFANNIVELSGASQILFVNVGEGSAAVSTYNIIEGNTLVGDRVNFFYDVGTAANVAATDAASAIALGNRIANNVFDQHSIKADFFDEINVKTQRAAAGDPRLHGYRPNATGSWAALYGVGFIDNVILRGNPHVEFLHEYEGLNTPNYTVDTGGPGDPKFANDQSGTDVPTGFFTQRGGGGDYTPLAGSPLIGRGRAANIDRDQAGGVRSVPFTVGAITSDAVAALDPAASRLATRAGPTRVDLAAALRVDAATLATRAGAAVVGWAARLVPAPTRHTTRDRTLPTPGPASVTPVGRTLIVTGDVRTTVIAPD